MGLLDLLAQRDSSGAGGFMQNLAANFPQTRGTDRWQGFNPGRGSAGFEQLMRMILAQQAKNTSKAQSPFSKG
jgi:hypothetical protein